MRGFIRPARSTLGEQGRAWTIYFRDGDGAQRQETVQGTKRQAQQVLTQRCREADTGELAAPGRLTVKAFLEKWLKDWAKLNLAPQSFDRYRMITEAHLVPALGEVKLAKLSALDLQEYCRKAMEDGRRIGKGGLARATVAMHMRVLHRALGLAVKWGYLTRNPVEGVELDKPVRRVIPILTKEQALKLIAGAQGDQLFMPIVLAMGLGLRRGEVLALQWGDIDLDAGTATIRRSMQEDGTLKAPKTPDGFRSVGLPTFVVAALKIQQAEQAKHREMYSDTYQDGGFVCATPEGRPFRHNCSFSKRFDRLLARLKLPDVVFHSLRHLYATLLIEDGENLKAVSQSLGHSDVMVTLRIYAHALPGAQARIASRVDGIMGW